MFRHDFELQNGDLVVVDNLISFRHFRLEFSIKVETLRLLKEFFIDFRLKWVSFKVFRFKTAKHATAPSVGIYSSTWLPSEIDSFKKNPTFSL